MDRLEFFDWMDVLAKLAFDSGEPLEDRMFYAEWWLSLAYHLKEEI